MHDFTDCPSTKSHEISTQQRRPVSRWKLCERNFENFTAKGRFLKKRKNFSQKFNVVRLQAAKTTQWLHIARNSLPNDPSTGCLNPVFTVRINSKSFPWDVCSVQETYPHFRHVRCLILGKPRTPQCGLADPHGRKADLNWKLKISNTADNADITQSQARDNRHCLMQEVNNLCTDSGPLPAEYCTAGIPHNTAI